MAYQVINLDPAKVTMAQKATAFLRRTEMYRSIAALMATMRVLPDERIPTACTDGCDWIKYSPDYMESMPDIPSAAAIFVHETLHKFNMIHIRFAEWKKRYPDYDDATLMKAFNMAQDYLMNFSIRHDWHLPIQDGWLYNPDYHMGRYTTEALADKLLQEQGQQGQGGQQGQSGDGDDTDQSGDSGGGGDQSGDSDDGDGGGQGKPGDGGMDAGDDVCIPSSGDGDGADGDGQGGNGSGSSPMTEDKLREMESKIKTDIARAARNAKGAGIGDSNFFQDQLQEKVEAPTADLKKEITRFAAELDRSGHTSWFAPNRKRRLPASMGGFPMPGPRDVKLGTVVVVIDKSGSTTGKAASYFVNTVVETFKNLPFKELVLLHHNTDPVLIGRYTQRQVQQGQVPTSISTCGGTRLRSTFEWIRDNVKRKITAVVWLTDGDVYQSDVMESMRIWQRKRYPLLWALFSNYSSVDTFINWVTVNAKFGRVSKLPQDKW